MPSSPLSERLTQTQQGFLYAFCCYLFWGLFPIYWYPLLGQPIDAEQLLAQRIVWSSVVAVALLLMWRQGDVVWQALKQPKLWRIFLLSALTLSINWLTYLWAVTHNHVLDASLGYFMSPLVSIVLGCVFLKEVLSRVQLVSVILVSAGVLWLALLSGHVPYVALLLSISFGLYGLLRKQAPLPALAGLTLETLMMLPFALLFLAWVWIRNELVFSELPAIPLMLVIGSGVVTTLPLLLFAAGTKRISLVSIGMIQYVSPTLQFLAGLFVFHEAFNVPRFIGYLWVWAGVGLFVWSSVYRWRKAKA
ncbi:EamA family transporter RarD [Stenoxybacter acetivorans]|uniref:EamA family transporter RarD n=1 Tax=Stenoxybacter acetivorans TaxID=422441 RepID=UPI00056BEFEA|nr:EamA family transporter RarD [Stenoxybacter acetivorans]